MEVVIKSDEEKKIIEAFDDLLKYCRKNITSENLALVKKAFHFANDAHKNMRRKSGEAYIFHPIAVAKLVAVELGLGYKSVMAALLHDVVEDTDYKIEDIQNLFGEKVASLVNGLTKLADVFDQTKSVQAENFKRMLLTLSDDIRVILIKLADRLHNMRTLKTLTLKKQVKIAGETLFIFAPLAHRMGLHSIKVELENLSLQHNNPKEYEELKEKITSFETLNTKTIKKFSDPIVKELEERGYQFVFKGRPKSIFSIWNKIHTKKVSFEEVYDRLATRIVFTAKPDIPEDIQCWEIYSVITTIYKPHPQRLRDWISSPKANGYEALHVTVMGTKGHWFEVQIRSERMDEIAKKGLAAHWKYKSDRKHSTQIDKWLQEVSEHLKSSDEDALSFLDDFKLNLFTKEIQVFSPKGDIHTLPFGATALDFAFKIHTDIGYQCIGAKVNYKLEASSYVLKSGDQVEILTSESKKPNPEWLDFVVTARAKSKIRYVFKREKKDFIQKGKKIIEEILEKKKLKSNAETYKKLLTHFNIQQLDELYFKTGKELINTDEIVKASGKSSGGKFVDYWKLRFSKSKEVKDKNEKPRKNHRKNKKHKISDETTNVLYHLAACCDPIPGDEVIGFQNTNNDVTIHKRKCEKALKLMSSMGNKIVEAEWTTLRLKSFPVSIRMTGIDSLGLLNQVTEIISKEYGVNMKKIAFESHDGVFEGNITLYIHNVKNLNNLMTKLLKIKGLKSVKRTEHVT